MKRLKVLQHTDSGEIWISLQDTAPTELSQFSSWRILADFELKEEFSIKMTGFLNPHVEILKVN